MPLLVFFHGQGGSAMGSALGSSYGALGEEQGFATAYPQGLADTRGASCGTGWNTEIGPSSPMWRLGQCGAHS